MELASSRVPFSAALIALLSLERIFALINRSLNRFMLIVTSTSSLFPRGGTKVHSVLAHEAKFQELWLCPHLNRHRLPRELFPAAAQPGQVLSGAPAAGEPHPPHHLHRGSLPHASSRPSCATQRYGTKLCPPETRNTHENIIKPRGDPSGVGWLFDPDPALAYPATPLRRAARSPPGRSPWPVILGCFQTRIRKGKPHGKGKPGSLSRSPALQTPSRRGGGPAAPCRRRGAAAPGAAGGPGHKGRERGAGGAGARPAGSGGRRATERAAAAAARWAVLPCLALPDGTAQSKR